MQSWWKLWGHNAGEGVGEGMAVMVVVQSWQSQRKPLFWNKYPFSLLRDFLAGNNNKLSQEEGSNTGSNNNSNGKDNEGADDNNSEEQVKEKNK